MLSTAAGFLRGKGTTGTFSCPLGSPASETLFLYPSEQVCWLQAELQEPSGSGFGAGTLPSGQDQVGRELLGKADAGSSHSHCDCESALTSSITTQRRAC